MSARGVPPDVLATEPRGRLRLAAQLLTPPLAWSLHLLGCYLLVTLDCTTAWNGSGAMVALLTVALAAVSLGAAAIARRRRTADTDVTGEVAAAGAGPSSAFLDRLTVTAGIFFAATIVMTGLAPLFVELCR